MRSHKLRKKRRSRNTRKSYLHSKSKRRSKRKSRRRSYYRRNLKGGMDASPVTEAIELTEQPVPAVQKAELVSGEYSLKDLENKVNLLAKLVIYGGPGEDHPKRKWGNNSFHKMLELFHNETLHYYDIIVRETGHKNIDIPSLEALHTGENRDDDIHGVYPPTDPHSTYKNKNF